MTEQYILAIDGGTQSTKVLIFDVAGNVVCEGKQVLRPTQAPRIGYVEHPDDDLWDALVSACRQALARFPGDPKTIVAVGLCTIRACRAFLRSDGSLAYPVIDWMDPRAYGPFECPATDFTYATTTTGYMTHRLTGEFRDTVANCTNRQWPTDMDNWTWSGDDEDFRSLAITREKMMELHFPGDILGTVTREAAEATGITAGLPVVATANDKAVEALGAGLWQPYEQGLISLGTYIASMVCGDRNRQGAANFWTNFASVPHRYLYESFGIRRGMWTVSWLKNLLGDEIGLKAKALNISPEEYLNREAEKVPAGSEGLSTVVEWLSTKDKPYKKGIMLGFDVRHTAAHMHRSIMEGIALTMKNRYDEMCDELGIHPGRITVSGGGSNSALFMQIFADVFGVPATRNEITGAAGLGSAICAAVATGIYPGFEEAVKAMVRPKDVFTPDPDNHSLYTRINDEFYRGITATTDAILKKAYPLFH
ncbi:MAG: sugar kinase [Planctomycetaceae bacterium]|nr:sugar kinase [Planctomycetaceae bacterium]